MKVGQRALMPTDSEYPLLNSAILMAPGGKKTKKEGGVEK